MKRPRIKIKYTEIVASSIDKDCSYSSICPQFVVGEDKLNGKDCFRLQCIARTPFVK